MFCQLMVNNYSSACAKVGQSFPLSSFGEGNLIIPLSIELLGHLQREQRIHLSDPGLCPPTNVHTPLINKAQLNRAPNILTPLFRQPS